MEVKKRRLDAAEGDKEAGGQQTKPLSMTGIHSMEDFQEHYFAQHHITLLPLDKPTLTPVHWIGPECNRKLREFLKLNVKQLCCGLMTSKGIDHNASVVPLVLDIIRTVVMMNTNVAIACNMIPHAVGEEELYAYAKNIAASATLPKRIDTYPDDLVDVAQAFQCDLHKSARGIGPQGRLQITLHDKEASRLMAIVEPKLSVKMHNFAGFYQAAAELAKTHLLHGATLPLWGVYTDHQHWQFLKMTKEADGRLVINHSHIMTLNSGTIHAPAFLSETAHVIFGMLFEMLQIPVDVDVSAAHAVLEERLQHCQDVVLNELDKVATRDALLVAMSELINANQDLINANNAMVSALDGTVSDKETTINALNTQTSALKVTISEKEAEINS